MIWDQYSSKWVDLDEGNEPHDKKGSAGSSRAQILICLLVVVIVGGVLAFFIATE